MNCVDGSKPLSMDGVNGTKIPTTDLQASVQEVQLLLLRTRKKSPAPDGIPFWIYLKFSALFAPAVTHIFNMSLQSGRVPMQVFQGGARILYPETRQGHGATTLQAYFPLADSLEMPWENSG